MKRLLFIFFFIIGTLWCHAQTYSTFGTDFWVTFLKNGIDTDTSTELTTSITVSSDRFVTGTVENPNTGWSTEFELEANKSIKIDIPKEVAYHYFLDSIKTRSVHITTSDTVWCYAMNYRMYSFDVANVVSTNMLSNKYMIQTYPYNDSEIAYGGAFLITATDDNTIVHITPTKDIGGYWGYPFPEFHVLHPANTMYSITLNQGESYLGYAVKQLSGSIIETENGKKVAVISGVPNAQVPNNGSACDVIFEPAFQPCFFGKRFAAIRYLDNTDDRICITAYANNTVVRKNNTQIATLQSGQTYEISLNNNELSCFIETSKPVAVYQYITGNQNEGSPLYQFADPACTWISSVEQKITKTVNQIYPTDTIHNHYVNIVTTTTNTGLMRMNQQNIASLFSPVTGNADYSFARMMLTDTINILENDSGFIAYYYGMGWRESYGYNAGFQMTFNPPQIVVNETPYILLPENQVFCISDSVHFSCSVDYEYDDIIWDFGDGETANGCAVSHLYTTGGIYPVNMIVDRTYPNLNNDMYDTVYAVLHLDSVRSFNIFDTICFGENYLQYDFNILQPEIGLFLDTIIYPGPICDSMNILNLLVLPNSTSEQILGEDAFCLGNTYTFSVSNASYFETFVWTVPDGCEIISGQNTSTIQTYFSDNMTSGVISVYIANACGNQTCQKNIDFFNVDDYIVSGGGSVCEGNSLSIHLNMSQEGMTYRIYRNGNMVGNDWVGDGMMHDFGPFSESGSYSVYMIVPNCFEGMVGEPVTIKITPNPPARIIQSDF